MICVICGKKQAVDHGMCEECLRANIKIEPISQVNLAICPKCGSVRIGKKWYKSDYAGKLMPVLMDELKCNDRDASLTGNPKSIVMDDQNKTINFDVNIERKYIDSIKQNVSVPYSVNYISCPTCNKLTGSYYEAVIQLRTLST
ncbi:MAG: NMD3-related protein, partial [Thermoplasmata archaeon]